MIAYVFSLYRLPVEDQGGNSRTFEALAAGLKGDTPFIRNKNEAGRIAPRDRNEAGA
ncbi:hypothetical protein [Rhodomicrobium lacus]|uniref:hypothetical protein n=1 Tax=Rhodomicrobium TaxID=1068 RepID=UPI0026E476B6|nr:hypothetical protein [Rhodomicrobium lacus]WKW51434.1 hypothetical protein QMO75_02795 [Rhodomicrobium lacus]